MLVVTSLMRQLTIGPGGDHVRMGRSLLWGHQRVAYLLSPHLALPIARVAPLADPNASLEGPMIEDVTDQI